MGGVWHVALHDWRIHLSDRANVFFMFLMPLGFILLFGTLFRDSGDPRRATVSLPVVDHDGGFLASAFAEQLRGEDFDVQLLTPAVADTLDLSHRAVHIPVAFTDSVLAGHVVHVELRREPGSNDSYDAAAQVRLHQAQVRFLGNLVRWNPPVSHPDSLSEAEKGRFLALIAEPSRVTVRSEYAGRGRPVPSGMGQSVPGILVMFVIMTVLIGGAEFLTREKAGGTLRRLASSPLSRAQILSGKVAGLTLLGLTQAIILMLTSEAFAALHLFGMDMRWLPILGPALLLLLPFTFCAASIALFIGGLFRTTQQAESISWLIGLLISGLGGCWQPLEIMPAWMRTLAHAFPTAWAMDGLHGLITFGNGLPGVVVPGLVLLLYGLVFWLLGRRTLKLAA